jgi:hypothetical protein
VRRRKEELLLSHYKVVGRELFTGKSRRVTSFFTAINEAGIIFPA